MKPLNEIFTHESMEEYQRQSDNYLSSHQLIDFIRCPLLFHKKQSGLIADKDSTSYLIGRAAHTLILEGDERYAEAYAIGGPVNPKTGKLYGANTKAFAEWAAEQGKPVLTPEQNTLVQSMAQSIRAHRYASSLLNNGVAEGVVRASYCGVPCQIRIDYACRPGCDIIDLKTCDDLTWFESDARRYCYHRQMAFYRAVLAQVIDQYVPVHLVAVEKKQPFRCGVWLVSEDTLAIAQRENEAVIRWLQVCHQRDHWPTGYEEVRVLDVA